MRKGPEHPVEREPTSDDDDDDDDHDHDHDDDDDDDNDGGRSSMKEFWSDTDDDGF